MFGLKRLKERVREVERRVRWLSASYDAMKDALICKGHIEQADITEKLLPHVDLKRPVRTKDERCRHGGKVTQIDPEDNSVYIEWREGLDRNGNLIDRGIWTGIENIENIPGVYD